MKIPSMRIGRWRAVLAGTVVAALGWSTVAVAAVDFAPRVTLRSSNTGNYWMTSGDLNADGLVDLIVSTADDTIVTFRGLGGGNFSGGTAVPVGSAPFGVATGDFNGDTKLDIATANSKFGNVTVLLGDGLGGITSTSTVTVGAGAASITAGDVNADTKTDLIVMNFESRNASLLLGNGDGTFVASFIPVGPFGFGSAVGDVTGDGITDLVVASSDGIRVTQGPTPAATPFQLSSDVPVFQLGLGDFNRDGRLDIAGARFGANDVSITLGLGGTAFSALTNYGVSNSPVTIVVADVTGEGVPDIVTANAFSNDISVLEGFGDGRFGKSKQFRAGRLPQGMAATDLNADGRADVVVSNSDGTVSILMSRALTPGTAGSATVRVPCATPKRVVLHTSIGCVAPGMSKPQVAEFLGKPRSIRRVAGGGLVYSFGGHFVAVDRFNSVTELWTRRPKDALANGLAIGSPTALVRKKFPKARCLTSGGNQICEVVRKESATKQAAVTTIVSKGGNVVEIAIGLG